MFYTIVEVKKLYQKTLSRGERGAVPFRSAKAARYSKDATFAERKATMAKKRKNYYGFVRKISDIG